MYKRIKLSKKYNLSFGTFPKTAKRVSKVYTTGIRNWIAQDSFNYSIVIYRFRIIFSIERNIGNCQY